MEGQAKSQVDKRFIVLMAFQCLSILLILILLISSKIGSSDGSRARLVRDTAAKLQAAGLTTEAISHYEEYLKEPGIDSKTRAKVSFSLAQISGLRAWRKQSGNHWLRVSSMKRFSVRFPLMRRISKITSKRIKRSTPKIRKHRHSTKSGSRLSKNTGWRRARQNTRC